MDRLEKGKRDRLWERMYLTSPPITQAIAVGPFAEDIEPILVRSETGLTMGNVAVKLWALFEHLFAERAFKAGVGLHTYVDDVRRRPKGEEVLNKS